MRVVGTTAPFLGMLPRLPAGQFFRPATRARATGVVVLGQRWRASRSRTRTRSGSLVRVAQWRFRVIGVLVSKGYFGRHRLR